METDSLLSLVSLNSEAMLATTLVQGSAQVPTKCDFCDLHLKTDNDISRHLSSDSHRSKIAQFLSLQNLNTKSVQKEVPKNLVQVFQALKLRSDRDARELADKTFFKIYDDAIAEIAMELNKSLFKSLVEFETRSLPPGVRTAFINALEHEEPGNETKKKQCTNADTSQQHKLKAKPTKPTDEVVSQPITNLSRETNNQAAQQLHADRLKGSEHSKQQQQPAPHVSKPSSEYQSVQESQNQQARKPGQIPRIQRQEPHHKSKQQPQPNTNKPAQPPRPQQQSRPVFQNKPAPPQPSNNQAPYIVPPQATPKNSTTVADGPPVPRLNSTYVPKIAVVPKIKEEPKDN